MTHFYVIAVLISLSIAGDGEGRWARGLLPQSVTPAASVAMILVPYLLLAVAGWIAIALCVRRLDRTGSVAAVRWSHRVLLVLRASALGWHLVTIPVLGLLSLVRTVTGDLIFVDELIAAVPALVFLLWTIRLAHPIEHRVRVAMLMGDLDAGRPVYPFPGPWAFVLGQARNSIAIIAVPIALLLAWGEGLGRLLTVAGFPGRFGLGPDSALLIESGIQIAGALVIFSAVPLVMVRVWDTLPIPPGVLRDDLERLARAHRVRVSRFLIWRTRGSMLNGAVIGLTPFARYIVLTDALLDALTEPEVEAVAAHEVAHVKERHMIWLALAILGSAMLGGEGTALIAERIGLPEILATSSGVVVSLTAVVLVLGFVSRRFEWQADAFAARHLSLSGVGSGGEPGDGSPVITHEASWAMSGALARVARLNGMSESRFTWRHGSIATRRQRLGALIGTPVGRLPIDRTVRTVRWLSVLAFLAGAALTAAGGLGLWPYAGS